MLQAQHDCAENMVGGTTRGARSQGATRPQKARGGGSAKFMVEVISVRSSGAAGTLESRRVGALHMVGAIGVRSWVGIREL